MRVTVGISTWNRANLLDKTLAEMLELRIPEGVSWELLVVNNNCTDETDAVISRYTNKLPLRRLFEPRPGKSHACNHLVAEATGDLVLWTDDDVLVAPEWLAAYCEAAALWPAATYFGGTIEPLYDQTPPAWAADNPHIVKGPFALLSPGPDMRAIADDEYPFGANMAVKIESLRATPFDCTLGPKGERILKGEDTKLIEELKGRGEPGIWVGKAKVRHWVPKERMTYKYIWDWYLETGVRNARRRETPGRLIFGMPRWVIRRYLEGIFFWFYGCLLRNSSMRVNGLSQWAYNAGMLTQCREQYKQESDFEPLTR